MKPFMSWNECKTKNITQIYIDKNKASSMLRMAELREESLKEEKTTFKKIEQYYEIIKELLTTHMLLEGLKSDNHECIIAYFIHIFEDLHYEYEIIHDLKKIRNKIQYDRFFPSENYLKRNELEFLNNINIIKLQILKKLNIS